MEAGFRILSVLVVGCGLAWNGLNAQCDGTVGPDGLSWDFDQQQEEGFSIGGFIGDMFTPQVVIDTKQIRSYVRDIRFRELTRRCGDMRAVDGIFIRALRIAEHNIGRALFLSMMAVLEHQTIDLKMPLIRSLPLPLTFEADSLFKARRKNLPTKIYSDGPKNEEGDRDKLQHFFASAYLSYASESADLTRTTGNLVEWGEAKFVVGGADDPRDVRANKQGEAFGRDLLIVKTLLPSDYLTLSMEEPEN